MDFLQEIVKHIDLIVKVTHPISSAQNCYTPESWVMHCIK